MTTIVCRKRGGALEPVDDTARKVLGRVKDADVVLVEVRRLRNPGHHRKFFAMLKLVFDNQTRYRSLDHLLDAIKVWVGHCRTMRLRDGREVYVPRSISWSSMDQDSFEALYNRVVDVVVTEIIPGVRREDLARQLREITET